MRNPKRIDRIAEKLIKLWKEYPDWRLGQLVSNIVGNDMFIFHIEDDLFEQSLDNFLKEVQNE